MPSREAAPTAPRRTARRRGATPGSRSNLGVRVRDARKVLRARRRAELVENLERAGLGPPGDHLRPLVGERSELDGAGGARLLACRHDLAGANRAALVAGCDLCAADALNA